jgi:hypothetical protein
MTGQVCEVHVSAQHWAEGCDGSLGAVGVSSACPVYRAMCEAGLPVSSVGRYGWSAGVEWRRFYSKAVEQAIRAFDRSLDGFGALPEPITFYVELP